MEDNFDVTVKTEPLVHVTKHRIKNNSRKISVPSRSHLKRNSVGQTWQEQTKNWSVEGTDLAIMEATSKKLKLPPPPVPKKPKVNLQALRKTSSKTDPKELMQHDVEDGGNKIKAGPPVKKKPAVPPKPSLHLSSPKSSLSKPLSLNLNATATNDNSTKTDNNIANGSPRSSSENSPTKTGMSFSERLKASSLSKRKEAKGPDGFHGKLRSHIISPVRRGSRSFMNTETALRKDSDEKPKTAPPIFKRYSSESSTKSILDKIEDDNFDLDEFKNLSLENVAPLPVNAVLSPDNSFDDDDVVSKDSFDSKELNMKFATDFDNVEDDKSFELNFESMKINTESQPENFDYLPKVVPNSTSLPNYPTDVIPVTTEDSSSLEVSSDAQHNTIQASTATDMNKVLQLPDKPEKGSSLQKETFGAEDLPLLQDLNAAKENPFEPKNSVEPFKKKYPDAMKTSPSIFTSPKRFGMGTKEGSNTRRKFRPVGMNELNADAIERPNLFMTSKMDEEKDSARIEYGTDEQRKEINDINDKESADLDSSLEHVTPDVTLDSTFEIIPKPSVYDLNGKNVCDDISLSGNSKVVEPSESMINGGIANEIDSSKLPSYEDIIIPAQATEAYSSYDDVDFFNDADLLKVCTRKFHENAIDD